MRKPIQISIPNPCHEDWQQMTPADKGRFCSSCQTKVYDFTSASDSEIALVTANEQNICVAIPYRRLNNNFSPNKSPLIAASFILAGMLALNSPSANAQVASPQKLYTSEKGVQNKEKVLVTGTVTYNNEPLPNVRVWRAEYTEDRGFVKVKKVKTDEQGMFSIEAKPGEYLMFIKSKKYESVILDVVENMADISVTIEDKIELMVIGRLEVETSPKTLFPKVENFN